MRLPRCGCGCSHPVSMWVSDRRMSQSRMLSMNPLPMLDMSGATVGPSTGVRDWGRAAGNLEDAKVSVEALKTLVNDAVFLDEDAYSGAVQIQAYTTKLQAAKRRIHDMEQESAALRSELDRKDDEISSWAKRHQEAQSQITELKSELESNAVVFQMHYQEIITRNEEIARLKAMIESLAGSHVEEQATPPS